MTHASQKNDAFIGRGEWTVVHIFLTHHTKDDLSIGTTVTTIECEVTFENILQEKVLIWHRERALERRKRRSAPAALCYCGNRNAYSIDSRKVFFVRILQEML